MSKKKLDESIVKLMAHVSMSLKSFDLTVSEWRSNTEYAHLQSLYKKKKYLFYITPELTASFTETLKFKATLKYCGIKGYNYVVIAKDFPSELEKYVASNDLDFKIIPFMDLVKVAKEYVAAKEAEAEARKIARQKNQD